MQHRPSFDIRPSDLVKEPPPLPEKLPPGTEDRCPCGGIILADTEDWKVPRCFDCWHEMGMPLSEPMEA